MSFETLTAFSFISLVCPETDKVRTHNELCEGFANAGLLLLDYVIVSNRYGHKNSSFAVQLIEGDSLYLSNIKWLSERKKTITIAIPKSPSGFGFTVAWTKPPIVDFVNEGKGIFCHFDFSGYFELNVKIELDSKVEQRKRQESCRGDKIVCIDKIPVSKKEKRKLKILSTNANQCFDGVKVLL
ncbi:hypothetical protein CEXT_423271 [Caerostris extrusa]|uniref:Uncharacterized protein n=1 Tax=Caerostris extrusa TaxID=172846 RepID=A0AAV4TC02_CAEEX|nr:hypothetical protein CEXT_423271 [Caerostris extrusa]